MEDRFSHDAMSNNLRDSHSNNGAHLRAKNINTGGSVNSLTNSKTKNSEIIPERRRKYLANASED